MRRPEVREAPGSRLPRWRIPPLLRRAVCLSNGVRRTDRRLGVFPTRFPPGFAPGKGFPGRILPTGSGRSCAFRSLQGNRLSVIPCRGVFPHRRGALSGQKCAPALRPESNPGRKKFLVFKKKVLTNVAASDRIISVDRSLLTVKHLAEWCNGNTNDSDSFILGSNPSSAAICLHSQEA